MSNEITASPITAGPIFADTISAYPPAFEQLNLTKTRVHSRTAVSNQLLHEANITTVMDDMRDQMILNLEVEVLTHKIAQSTYTMTVPYPASPWHHFKHRHRSSRLMAWWIKRHPIKYTKKEGVVTLSKEHRFPDAKISVYPDSLGIAVPVETGTLTTREPVIGGCGCPERP